MTRATEPAADAVPAGEVVRHGEVEREVDPTPGLSGPELLERSRRLPSAPGIKTTVREDRAARQAAWQHLPHRLLSDPALDEAIARASRDHQGRTEVGQRLREQLVQASDEVGAGRGAQVRVAADRLAAIRETARQHAELAAAQERTEQARQQRDAASRDRAQLRAQAQTTPWYRPGRREQLQADIAAATARYEHARAQLEQLGAQLEAQWAELGRCGQLSLAPEQAQAQLERAEADYPQEWEAAQQADEAALARQQERLERQLADAERSAARHAALAAEQDRRAERSAGQRLDENIWRLQETVPALAATPTPQRGGVDYDSDEAILERARYQQPPGVERGIDPNPGRGYGMGR